MKLYMHAAACSLAPHIVARELGLPIELVAVDRTSHKTPSGDDYLALNSMGYVPGLALDDGRLLLEGPAIVQYLADLRPDAGLAPPAGTAERTTLHMMLNFITSEIHKPLAMLLDPAFRPVRDVLLAKVDKRFDWIAARLAPYAMGARFSVADPYLFVCLNWTQRVGPSLEGRPALRDFMRAIAARPHVQAALAAEDLVTRDPASPYFLPRHMIA